MAGSLAGTVELTKLIEHACRLIVRYRSRMTGIINAGVINGAITGAQAATLSAWLDALAGICLILKALTGY